MKICVTGGLGSGKSRVLAILRAQGDFVLSADEVNAEMLRDPEYLKKLQVLFPSCVNEGGADRAAIRKEIERSQHKRLALNALSHNEIFARIQEKASQVERVFFEIPLLTAERAADFDKVWYVSASEPVRVRRIMERDGVAEQSARFFVEVQREYQGIKQAATSIIHNEGDEDLEAEVLRLLAEVKLQR